MPPWLKTTLVATCFCEPTERRPQVIKVVYADDDYRLVLQLRELVDVGYRIVFHHVSVNPNTNHLVARCVCDISEKSERWEAEAEARSHATYQEFQVSERGQEPKGRIGS